MPDEEDYHKSVTSKIDSVLRSQCITRRTTTFLRIDALIVASRQYRGVDVDLPSPDPEESKDGLYTIEADGVVIMMHDDDDDGGCCCCSK